MVQESVVRPKAPKAPKAPKVKVEVAPSTEFNPVLKCLNSVVNGASDSGRQLREVFVKLPKGTFTEKVQMIMLRKIGRIVKVTEQVGIFLDKRSLTLGRRIAQAATKEQRKADRVKRAEARLAKAQVAVAKAQSK